MRKMTLDLDKLTVDSFEMAAAEKDARGTVRGNADTLGCSFRNSCIDTCALSCGGSCYTGLNCHQVC